MTTEKQLREALESIANPIAAMQKQCEEGARIDGMMAQQLSNDANYLKGIARTALLIPQSPRIDVEQLVKELVYLGFMSAHNAHRQYPDNKHTFSDHSDYLQSQGEEIAARFLPTEDPNDLNFPEEEGDELFNDKKNEQ